MIDFYNEQREKFKTEKNFEMDAKKISWTSSLLTSAKRDEKIIFDSEKIFESNYRPFCKNFFILEIV